MICHCVRLYILAVHLPNGRVHQSRDTTRSTIEGPFERGPLMTLPCSDGRWSCKLTWGSLQEVRSRAMVNLDEEN